MYRDIYFFQSKFRTMLTYLSAQFDARKSFYNKATLIHKDDSLKLYSCNTLIAIWNKPHQKINVAELPKEHRTATTKRHLKEFIWQSRNTTVNHIEISCNCQETKNWIKNLI